MKFEKHFPGKILRPYIKYYVVSVNDFESQYKVFPSSGLVMGFQYEGQLLTVKENKALQLSKAGITGISDTFKEFKNADNTGSILVYFTETGFAQFASNPADELFNVSLSLEDIFGKNTVDEVTEKLSGATLDCQRINIVERFLLSHLTNHPADKLIMEAVKIIQHSKGAMRIKDLTENLCISQSPFEKRFRKTVGTTAKKFASITRFNSILDSMHERQSLTDISYDNNFFDQAHFIKDFNRFTGETPEKFRRTL